MMNSPCLYYQSKVEVSSKNTAKMSVCEKYRKVQTKAAIGRAGSLGLVTVRLLTTTYHDSQLLMGIKRKEASDDVLINNLEEWNNLKNIPGEPITILS